MEKKIEYLIDMRINTLKDQLQSANNQISELQQEIATLKNKVQRLDSGVQRAPANPQTTLVTEEQKPQQASSAPMQPDNRAGSYTPEDVSVDKMFYYGNK